MYYVSIRHDATLSETDRSEALKEIREARTPDAQRPNTPEADILFREVVVYAQLGDLRKAFEVLERLQETAPAEVGDLKKSPALREFRMDPRFSQITGNGR